jgi:hypothetical protein
VRSSRVKVLAGTCCCARQQDWKADIRARRGAAQNLHRDGVRLAGNIILLSDFPDCANH